MVLFFFFFPFPSVDGKDLLVFHGYNANDKGRSKLRIKELNWDAKGWPFVKQKN
jgi:arabinan endo-1,5-alpha-L-arabinosidase